MLGWRVGARRRNAWSLIEWVRTVTVDVSDVTSPHPLGNKIARVVWGGVWLFLYRPSPKVFHGWRRFLLRLFGAKVGAGVHPYPSARIWAPWNLEMGDHSCLGFGVDCYSVAKVQIGAHATISQYSYLCSASHDLEHPNMPLITAPIRVGDGCWLAADVFVGPGVTVGEGAVVGARSTVLRDVEPWTIVVGTPARFIRRRKLKSHIG